MLFCKRERLKESSGKAELKGNYFVSIFHHAKDLVGSDWEALSEHASLFLSVSYLRTMEELTRGNIQHRYVIVYQKEVPVLGVYLQIIDFTADVFGDLVSGQISEIRSKRKSLFSRYLNHKRDKVIMRLVTCGNNFISGEHGFTHSTTISRSKSFDLVTDVIGLVSRKEKLRGKISATLVKDFYSKKLPKQNAFTNGDFTGFQVEPNMVVEFPPQVRDLKAYISLFSKKYRNRAKAILNAGAQIEIRKLEATDLSGLRNKMYALYEQVYNRAKFKLVKISPAYFEKMKAMFGEKFEVFGFFKDGNLLAFSSGFILNNTYEAHYIGLNYEANRDFELYQNILYHFLGRALKNGCSTLNLGRTASEIKSTIGAKAQDLTCYIRPQNTVSKILLHPFISFLQPSEWIPRNPFKESEPVSQSG